jgi:hypothetical protein
MTTSGRRVRRPPNRQRACYCFLQQNPAFRGRSRRARRLRRYSRDLASETLALVSASTRTPASATTARSRKALSLGKGHVAMQAGRDRENSDLAESVERWLGAGACGRSRPQRSSRAPLRRGCRTACTEPGHDQRLLLLRSSTSRSRVTTPPATAATRAGFSLTSSMTSSSFARARAFCS